MDANQLRDYLKKITLPADAGYILSYTNRAAINKDFSKQTITHTILDNSNLTETNFDYAAVTGSIFSNCSFKNCSMEQSDFEFCEFNNCEFHCDKEIISSFNNSTFINTKFIGLTFMSSTFTDAYFEGCIFEEVSIVHTTLENALFRNCKLKKMDLRNLNMDYIEFDNPEMEEVVLPMAQIPYMFGCLQYLKSTEHHVAVSGFDNKDFSVSEYLEEIIPELIEFFSRESEYFPLANIFLFQRNAEKAIPTLKDGLTEAMVKKDFRMIKFYCKLISQCNLFKARMLHEFYNQICKLLPIQGGTDAEAQSYIRNIGEIKYILFDRTRKPSIHITFLTNIRSRDADRVAIVLGHLFSIAKMGFLNDVSLTITENSPLLIEAQVSGEEENLAKLLPLLIMLTGVPVNELQAYPLFYLPENVDLMEYQDSISVFQAKCASENLHLSIVNYYAENFRNFQHMNFRIYYNSSNWSERYIS